MIFRNIVRVNDTLRQYNVFVPFYRAVTAALKFAKTSFCAVSPRLIGPLHPLLSCSVT